jgi:hypothetical protein
VRYATPGERASSQTPKKTPTSSMKSKTDRFTLPGGVYMQSLAPPPNAYEPKKLDSGMAVSMMQKMVRRRQSRGIFAEALKHASEVPCPMQYEGAPSAMAEASASGRPAAWAKNSRGRFEGHGTVYAKESTPSAGEYDTAGRSSASKSATPSASFQSNQTRFDGPGNLYAREQTPAVGSYNTTAHESAKSVSTKPTTSIFTSVTDRFALPGGAYFQSDAPPPGTYEPRKLDPGMAVSMVQKMVRRRQSRGIFEDVLKRASEMPSPLHYAGAPSAMAAASASGRPAAWARGIKGRFDGHDTVYAKEPTPGIGEYETAAPSSKSAAPSASFQSVQGRFDGPGNVYTRELTPAVGSYDTTAHQHAKSASIKPTTSIFTSETNRFALPGGVYAMSDAPPPGTYDVPRETAVKGAVSMLQKMVRRRQSRGVWADAIKHASEVPCPTQYDGAPSALASAVMPGRPAAWSKDTTDRFEGYGGVYQQVSMHGLHPRPAPMAAAVKASPVATKSQSAQRTPTSGPKYSIGGTAVGVYEPVRFEGPPAHLQTIRSAEKTDHRRQLPTQPKVEPPEAKPCEAEDGEALFKTLQQVSSTEVARHDYFDEANGWDLQGLKDDLSIGNARAQKPVELVSAASEVSPAFSSSTPASVSNVAAAGTAVALSQLTTFLRAFCFSIPSESSKRAAVWAKWDTNGNGHLSLAEVDVAVKTTLQDFVKDEAAGDAIWKRFRPSLIRAFNDAKDAAAAPPQLSADNVDSHEFRILVAYLGYFSTWFEVFSMVDGAAGDTTAIDDRRISLADWELGLSKVVRAGLTWAPYVALRSATKASFAQMDLHERGYVLLNEFCDWVKAAEIEAKTPAGSDLSAGARAQQVVVGRV